MNMSEEQRVTSQLVRPSLITLLSWLVPAAPVLGYLTGLALGLGSGEALKGSALLMMPLVLVLGVGPAWAATLKLARGQPPSGAPEEARLEQLLQLPWRLAAAGVVLPGVLLGGAHALAAAVMFERGLGLAGLGLLLGLAMGLALSVPVGIQLEQQLMPLVLAEQERLGRRPQGGGLFWPRQSWALPAVLALSLATTLPVLPLTVGVHAERVSEARQQAPRANPAPAGAQADWLAEQLDGSRDALVSQLAPALLMLGGFMLLTVGLGGWALSRRQARALADLQQTLQALSAQGSRPPRWASCDELGELSVGLLRLHRQNLELPASLQAAATQLLNTSSVLDAAGGQHREGMIQQSSALQEAQVTTQEIRQTSTLASRRVENVLKVVARAEALGASGEKALDKTLAGLNAIRDFTEGIRGRVGRVQECASQIGDIAITVKDLASQTNVLSINAAIEAARSGEHGSGFAVVAQELRKLTDQSIRETVRIGAILEQVGTAIQELVAMSDQGARQVDGGLEMVKSSGDSLRELSVIIRENAAAARMIANAVSQQDTGISQIFTAISQLATGMNESMERMEQTLEATRTLETVTQQVQELARRYQPHA